MNISGQTLKMLQDYFVSSSENPAKAKIVFKAIYKEKVTSFFDITAFSESVKAKLSADFEFTKPHLLPLFIANGVPCSKSGIKYTSHKNVGCTSYFFVFCIVYLTGTSPKKKLYFLNLLSVKSNFGIL